MQKLIWSFIIIITASFQQLNAQSTILKVAPLDAFFGQYTFSGEYAFNQKQSLILNAQYRSIDRDYANLALFWLALFSLSNETYQEEGRRYDLGYRHYFNAEEKHRFYMAGGLGYRKMDLLIVKSGLSADRIIIDDQIKEISLFVNAGMQWKMGEHFVLDTALSMRRGFTKQNYDDSFFRTIEQTIPRLDVKLGYRF